MGKIIYLSPVPSKPLLSRHSDMIHDSIAVFTFYGFFVYHLWHFNASVRFHDIGSDRFKGMENCALFEIVVSNYFR